MSAPTPASDGEWIVALFASNDVICLDLDGNLQWIRSLGIEYPFAFDDRGLASSPLIIDGVVVVQVACQGTSFVTAIEMDTGTTRWTRELTKQTSWASPCSAVVDGKSWVVVQSADELLVLDPASGEPRWRHSAEGALIPSPVVRDATIYLPAERLLRMDLAEDGTDIDIRWEENSLGPQSASAVVANDHVFVIRPPNILTCGRTEDGDVVWKKRLQGKQFWATPALAGNVLYVASADGVVQAVDIAEDGNILGTSDMQEELLGSPAISGDALYLRGVTHVWKIAKTDRPR